ncbi:hypothetical protein B0H14DRAFT_2637196 [Mycena olivaceomarginata]|nr:hypothetical protein B0H14DRAFT_2637196 [Mycena olivaceomarginata]
MRTKRFARMCTRIVPGVPNAPDLEDGLHPAEMKPHRPVTKNIWSIWAEGRLVPCITGIVVVFNVLLSGKNTKGTHRTSATRATRDSEATRSWPRVVATRPGGQDEKPAVRFDRITCTAHSRLVYPVFFLSITMRHPDSPFVIRTRLEKRRKIKPFLQLLLEVIEVHLTMITRRGRGVRSAQEAEVRVVREDMVGDKTQITLASAVVLCADHRKPASQHRAYTIEVAATTLTPKKPWFGECEKSYTDCCARGDPVVELDSAEYKPGSLNKAHTDRKEAEPTSCVGGILCAKPPPSRNESPQDAGTSDWRGATESVVAPSDFDPDTVFLAQTPSSAVNAPVHSVDIPATLNERVALEALTMMAGGRSRWESVSTVPSGVNRATRSASQPLQSG